MSFSPKAGAVISFTVEGAQEARRDIETIGGSFNELSTVATSALKVLAAGYAAINIGAYVKDATLLAARYETLGIVMKTAGVNAGYSGAQMDAHASDLEKSGISMVKAREAMISMTTANLDNNKSLELGRLAQNLAVVANKSSSETLTDLIQNIQQADTEGLKHMGIILDQNDALQKYATSHNTVTKALTQTQKAEAIQQAVMLQGAKYAGIYEQAMGTAGKALGSLDRYFENIKVRLGTPLLEGFAQGVFGVTDGVKQLNKWLEQLETNGAMEKYAKDFGTVVGDIVKGAALILKGWSNILSWTVAGWTEFKHFYDEHKDSIDTIALAVGAFATVYEGALLLKALPALRTFVAESWIAAGAQGVVGALGAMSTAVVGFVRAFTLSAALVGFGPAIVAALGTAAAAIGAFVVSAPALVIGIFVALAVTAAAIFSKTFRQKVSEWTGGMLFKVDAPKAEVSDDGGKKQADDATKAAANKAEKDRKDLLMQALNNSVVAAEGQVALTSATNTKLKALNDLRDQQLKQSLDQRTIAQADYLQKKEAMDVASAQGEINQIAAQKAQLAAYMAAFKAGAPLGQGRDPAADANEMTKLLGDEAATQTRLNAVKQNYSYQIAGALIESYTKEFGSISSIVDAQEQLNRSTKQTYAQAGLTAQQQDIWSAQYLQSSADRLSADEEGKTKNGTASKEYLENTSAMITALTGLSAAKMKAVAPEVSAQFINDAKSMRDETTALYDDMRNTIVGTDEARIRSAAAATIKLAAIRRADAQDAINGSNDSDGDKLAKSFKLFDDYNKYVSEVSANADAKVMQSSAGYQALSDVMSTAFDPARIESFGSAMKDAFGTAGEAVGGLVDAFSKYAQQQNVNDKARKEASVLYANDAQTLAAANSAITSKQQKEQLAYYGNVADAAKGFFKEGSTGYKTLQAVSETFHAVQMALSVEEMVAKLFATTTVTTAKVAAAGTEVAASTATLAPTLAVEGAKSSAYGVSALAAALAAPFPANIPAFATVAAMLLAIGVAVSGAGGGAGKSVSQQRQEAQGAGTVLGDSSAKSESVNNAIKLSAANSSTQINYLSGLLTTLKTIQSSITSFAGQLVSSTDVTGAALSSSLATSQQGFFAKLGTAIFGGKTTVDDTGFTLANTSVGSALANGVQGKTYADTTKSGGWFSSDSHDTKTTDLSADANRQFTTIIESLVGSIKDSAKLLGVSGDSFTNQLNSFVIDIGKVSLKGLTGSALTDAISSVFSKLGDQMAQAALPDLAKFQQVGEGYLETLVRVASDYAKVDASLQSVGLTFGSVGVASLAAREDLIAAAGGIDAFQSQAADFATNFLTKAQQLAPVQAFVTQQLAAMGEGWIKRREDFAAEIASLGGHLDDPEVQKTYAALMNLESAFASVTPAIVDATKSAQDIIDERKDLQDQLDTLTMTQVQLNKKARDAISDENKALYDQVQVAQAAKNAIDTQNSLLDLQSQIYALTGDKAAAAAVLEEQHAIALAALDPALQGATQNLWNLQAAATATSTAKSDSSALLSNVDTAYSTLDTVIQREKDALQKRIDVENDVVTKLTSLGSLIKSALSSYDVASDPVADRKAAQSTLASSLALMQSGTTLSDAQVTALQDALTTATKDSKGQFGSYEDYMFDMLKTQRQIAQLGAVTNDQETTAEKQLDQMKAQSTALDDQLAAAKQQVDLLKGIDTSTMTLAQAASSFQLSLSTAQANPLLSATPAITQAYQDALGRVPDAAGLAYWQNQVASGTSTADAVSSIKNSKEASIDKLYESLLGRPADSAGLAFYMGTGESLAQIAADLKASPEYKGKIPGFASGGDHTGGWRIVGEDGPELEATGPARIFNARQTSGMLGQLTGSSSDNAALFTAALAKMQQTMEKLRAETRATAIHSAKTAGLLKRVIKNDTLDISTPKPIATTVTAE